MKNIEIFKFLIKNVPRYLNITMVTFLIFMSGYLFIYSDQILFDFKHNINYVDLFSTRLGVLSLIFFFTSLTILFLNISGFKQVTSEYIIKITNWFTTFFLATVNSVVYSLVLNVYNCISSNSLLDKIFDNKFLTVNRFWSRETLIASIDSKINELNNSFTTSVKLNSNDYQSILDNSSGMGEALKLTEVVYNERLAEMEAFQNQIASRNLLNDNVITFPSITNFIGNHILEIGFVALVVAFGIFCVRTHYIQAYTLKAADGLTEASKNLGAQLIGTTASIEKVENISNTTSELTRDLLQTAEENQESIIEMLNSVRNSVNRLTGDHQQLDFLVRKIRNSVAANEHLLNTLIAELMDLDVLPSEGSVGSSSSSSSSTFQPFSGEGRSLND
jgi:hypothetical protein